MVRRGFPFGFGLFDGMVDTFFIVEGSRRLPLRKDAVIQDVPCAHHGNGPIEGLAEGHTSPPEAIPLALALELILPVLEQEGGVSGEGAGVV